MTADTAPDTAPAAGSLAGVRVLDIGQFLAGPAAATWLGDFGADVIKVERPTGDDQRRWGKPKNGYSLYWKLQSRNKRCVTLNLKSADGCRILLELVKHADVVVENFRPGKLAEMGLGYNVLAAVNPGVVLLSVSAFGQTGPYSRRPGFGTLAEAMSGYAHITGQEGGPPTLPAFGLADSIAGLTGAFSVLAALRHRDATGLGQHIDVSLLEPLMSMLGPMFIEFDQLGTVPQRLGSRLPFSAPRNIYLTADDKWLAMSSSGQRAYERSIAAIGRSDLITDERFSTNRERGTNVDELDKIIGAWVAERTMAEVLEIMVPAGAAVAPVYGIEDIFADPQIQARDGLIEVMDDDIGPVRMQNVPARLSRTQPSIRFAGRSLGADNQTVYEELLGLTTEDLEALRAAGVI